MSKAFKTNHFQNGKPSDELSQMKKVQQVLQLQKALSVFEKFKKENTNLFSANFQNSASYAI